jgi:hypothetical protein
MSLPFTKNPKCPHPKGGSSPLQIVGSQKSTPSHTCSFGNFVVSFFFFFFFHLDLLSGLNVIMGAWDLKEGVLDLRETDFTCECSK